MQEQSKFKYIYNGKEVSRKEFEKLSENGFRYFDGDSIVSVPFSSFDTFFNGGYRSNRQIDDYLIRYRNKVVEYAINKLKCSPQCYCDGRCKKDLEGIVEKNTNSTRHKSQSGETHKELKNDYPELSEGVKLNKNKPQLSLLFRQFPKALEAIVKCSEYGHEKYKETDQDYLNYQRVKGGSQTYADAGLRHRLQQGNDLESKLPHQFHVAWNALAELELWMKENVK